MTVARHTWIAVLAGAAIGCSSGPPLADSRSPSSDAGHDAVPYPTADASTTADAADGAADTADATRANVDADDASESQSGDAEGDGSPGDGSPGDGSPGDETADAPSGSAVTLPGALCDAGASWGPGTPVDVAAPPGAIFQTITPDELTIAWTYDAGASVAVAWADRATTADPFGDPQTAPSGTFADDRVAISPDGLRLVVLNDDRKGFSEMTRPVRAGAGNAFGAPATGAYANFDASGALGAGQSFGDPVLADGDGAFYYSLYDGVQTATLYRTARLSPGDAWPLGAPISGGPDLAAQGVLRRRPTGVSSDQATLFFWDEVAGIERAAWIDAATGAFDSFVDLGARAGAVPNAACDRLYYAPASDSGNGAASVAAR
jgi:hypothetical protein